MASCLAIGVVEMELQTFIDYAFLIELIASLYLYFRAFWRPLSSITFEYVSLLVSLALFNIIFFIRVVSEHFSVVTLDTIGNLMLLIFSYGAMLLVWWMNRKYSALSAKDRTLVLVSTYNLPERLVELMKSLQGSVCYISLTNACPHAKETFKRVAKGVKKMRFLSVSDSSSTPAEELDGQRLVLSKLLKKVVEEKYDYILVDDLCAFGLSQPELESLVSSVANMAHVKKTGLVLMCNRDHLSPEVILDLEMFMDKTIK